MIIVIPSFQPDYRVLKLIEDIQANSEYKILLVNDGSDKSCDSIFENAKNSGCIVLNHEVNMGKGAALKTAFAYLLDSSNEEGIICADCDGQHTWKDIEKLAKAMPSHPDSILLGCREFIGKVPAKSMFGNMITRGIFAIITGNRIGDTQTGLRGFTSAMLPWLAKLRGSRYEYEMNQLLEAKKAGYDFFCISIETIYENNNQGSHFHPIRDSIRIYLPILKFCISSVTCGILDFALLLLFKMISGSLLYSVIASRVVSSLCNYLLNKNMVFDAKAGKKVISLIQYYLLVAVILGLNYLLISFMNETIGIPLIISKLLTEGLLFALSYTVQHKIIFKKEVASQKNSSF